MYPIASVTLGSANTVSFSSIPQTFTHLQLRVFGRSQGAGNGAFNLQINGDGGANYGFGFHYLLGDGASASSGTTGSGSQAAIYFPNIASSSETSGVFGNVIIDILDYTNTNKNKVTRAIGGYDNNGSGKVQLTSGLWLSTAAITSLTFASSTSPYTFAAGTRFDLYGIQTSNATGA
jgi:hypothetical protein